MHFIEKQQKIKLCIHKIIWFISFRPATCNTLLLAFPSHLTPLHQVDVPADPTEVGWREHAQLAGWREESKLLTAVRHTTESLTAFEALSCRPLEGRVSAKGENGNRIWKS